MRSLCHSKVKTLQEYMNMEPSRIYVCDLNHVAPTLIKQAKTLNIPIYGSSGRRPKGQWISICATGKFQPTTYWIKLSTGTILLNYSSFDTKKEIVPEEDMQKIVTQIEEFEPSLEWTTSNRLIEKKVPAFLEWQCQLSDKEKEYYD